MREHAFPTEIVGIGRSEITIAWDDGSETRHDARDLRLSCGCAQCVDEWSGERRVDSGNVPWPLHCARIELVGNYGIRFTWSDGHNLGIFRLSELRSGDLGDSGPA